MTDRELMQQALDALEQSVSTCFDQYSHHEVMSRPEHFMNRAMKALRERLAQPEPTLALWNFKHNRLAGLSDDRAEVALIRQREWKGLTKEEARELCVANVPYVVDMVAALEARLKEKNT